MEARESRGNDRRNSSYDTELGFSIGHWRGSGSQPPANSNRPSPAIPALW